MSETSPPRPPPAKRVKLEPPSPPPAPAQTQTLSQIDLERAVGITEYIDSNAKGWYGILKQRYTDFLVNEIDEEGNVVHLMSLEYKGRGKQAGRSKEKKNEAESTIKEGTPTPAPTLIQQFELSPSDAEALTSLTTPAITAFCTTLYNTLLTTPTIPATSITTPLIPSKSSRSTLHALIRRLFSSTLETQTLTGALENHIRIQPATPSTRTTKKHRGNRAGKNHPAPVEKFDALGGEYCHFTLYKENRDTMQAVGLLARLLRLGKGKKNVLGFAGTKDRRAVTVQRCSAFRVRAERLAALNEGGDAGLRQGTRVGDFEYKTYGLELGDLGGNEFCITLRECAVEGGGELETVVRAAVDRVRECGFINYFGLQRFGSFSVGTWEVGVQLLLGAWRTVVEKILDYDEALLGGAEGVNQEDRARAEACALFLGSWEVAKAAEMIPRRYIAESTILGTLHERGSKGDGKGGGLDYLGALQAVPRNLRTMYTHAYQSYVWNHVASARVRMGRGVVEGDLVLIETGTGEVEEVVDEVDQDGEIVVNAPVEKGSGRPREGEEFARARALTKEEAESGRYGLRDVVLPTPGWDVVYPQNGLLEVYKSVMKAHGLDPLDMRRSQREYSLPGGYRKVVAGFVDGGCECEVRRYRGLEQVVSTDMEILEKAAGGDVEAAEDKMETDEVKKGEEVKEEEEEEKIAVVLRLKLGTSTYATMALRELMREGIRAYKPEFSR